MTVKMMGGMLVTFTQRDHMHRMTLVQPLGPMTLPAKAREMIASGEIKGARVTIPDCVAHLMLYGGSADFIMTAAFVGPPNVEFDVGMDSQAVPWPKGEITHALNVDIKGLTVNITAVGRYAFRFLADGEPIGEVSLPILWDDGVSS